MAAAAGVVLAATAAESIQTTKSSSLRDLRLIAVGMRCRFSVLPDAVTVMSLATMLEISPKENRALASESSTDRGSKDFLESLVAVVCKIKPMHSGAAQHSVVHSRAKAHGEGKCRK
jgi:hypothetical protein